MSQQSASFKPKTVSSVLKLHLKNEKVTVKKRPLCLVTELMRIFSKEALTRAADQAKNEGDSQVTLEHFEKILPQLLLDM
ncbi:centromere protein X [Aplysia californica]|uniref:Centromere protein X n=1 Tax=Aplysia californica TaxID=6500 RepID=A0ABM0JLN0_APLCA|nr:centromere protein X [Aplysia californica]